MIPLVTRNQSRELDRQAIKEMGIPGIQLMGNAGQSVADFVLSLNKKDSTVNRIAIVCGKGNNGGDGFAAAIPLKEAGLDVTVFSLVDRENIQGDSLHFFRKCDEVNIPIQFGSSVPEKEEFPMIIDGIFGTGFHGELDETIADWTQWIQACSKHIVAIDIPSGVDAESGTVSEKALNADTTITMGYVKVGMTLEPGKSHCGNVVPVDIGFPSIFESLPGRHCFLYTREDAIADLPTLTPDTHKHHRGKVLIIAGSKGLTGAAALATYGALRAGAGLTVTLAPTSIESTYETLIVEGMTHGLPDNGKGYFIPAGIEAARQWIDWCDAIVIGPGLGRESETIEFLTQFIPTLNKPMIIDADGFQPFIRRKLRFDQIQAPFMITPHYGEWAQIGGFEAGQIRLHLQDLLAGFFKEFNGVLALKNAPTCTVFGDDLVMNSSGNPGMATAGSGDVFSGICGTFLAQGLAPKKASMLAAFIHGLAGDESADTKGGIGMIARDLLGTVRRVIDELDQAS